MPRRKSLQQQIAQLRRKRRRAGRRERDRQRKTVLVVEDNVLNRELTNAVLVRRLQRRLAKDGAEALMSVGREKIDLILLDIDLPFIDGHKVLEALREKGIDVPTIFISGLPGEEPEVRAFEIGAIDFIRKPVKNSVLLLARGRESAQVVNSRFLSAMRERFTRRLRQRRRRSKTISASLRSSASPREPLPHDSREERNHQPDHSHTIALFVTAHFFNDFPVFVRTSKVQPSEVGVAATPCSPRLRAGQRCPTPPCSRWPARRSRCCRTCAEVTLDPELALTLLVAPVLLDAAFDSSPRDLGRTGAPSPASRWSAVALTVAAVALVARWLVPGIPWPAAIALGAIVAPPDAAAATAVLKQLRPPHRILVILQGESLFNDASALLIYRIAVAAAITGSFVGWARRADAR